MHELQHIFEQRINLYQVLELDSPHVSDSQIKKQFRSLALKFHPDKNPDNPQVIHRFHLLSLATHVLTDGALRGQYDRWLQSQDDGERRELIERLNHRESQTNATRMKPTSADVSPIQNYGQRLRKLKHFKLSYDWSPYGNDQKSTGFQDSATLRVELQKDPLIDLLSKNVLQDKLESLWNVTLSTVYYSSRNRRQDETVVAYAVFASPLDSRHIYKYYRDIEKLPKPIKQISPRIPVKYYKRWEETPLSPFVEQFLQS